MSGASKRFSVIIIAFMVLCLTAGTCFAGVIKDSIKVYDKGKKYYDREKYDKAIECFEEVVGKYPETDLTQIAMYFLADSYAKSGNKDKAAAAYSEMVKKYKSGFWVKKAEEEMKKLK